jgi:hypothetical protein
LESGLGHEAIPFETEAEEPAKVPADSVLRCLLFVPFLRVKVLLMPKKKNMTPHITPDAPSRRRTSNVDHPRNPRSALSTH